MILVISQQIKILFRIGIIRIEEKLFDSIAIYLSNYYYEIIIKNRKFQYDQIKLIDFQ